MSRRRQKRNQELYWSNLPGLFDSTDSVAEEALSVPAPELSEQPKKLRFISFGSGSSGNCAYVGCEDCGVLIDAGVDNNKVLEQLALNSIDIRTIGGILLTHDHSDHVRFAYAILRRHQHMRLYCTPRAFEGILRRHNMSRRIKDYHAPIYKEFPFKIGPMTITAFENSHDASDCAGFAIEGLGTNFVVATDTGIITERADFYIRRANYLMVESNYDEQMLRNGRYPAHLKARIASTIGHMDNADTARYLAQVVPAMDLRRIFLCHLSQDNNTPQIALATVRTALEQAGVCVAPEPSAAVGRKVHLSALPRLESSPLVTLV